MIDRDADPEDRRGARAEGHRAVVDQRRGVPAANAIGTHLPSEAREKTVASGRGGAAPMTRSYPSGQKERWNSIWRQAKAAFFARTAVLDELTRDHPAHLGPAVAGLHLIASGGEFTPDGTAEHGPARRFLGWTTGPHWLLQHTSR